MTYTPSPNRKLAVAATVILIISTLVFIGFSLTFDSLGSKILKLSALIFFLGALLTVSRYLTFTYTYATDENDFVIFKHTGKRRYAVCRLSYAELTDILPYKKAKNKLNGSIKRDMTVSLFAKNTYCLFYETADEKGVLILETVPGFAEHLGRLIPHVIPLELQ